MQTSQEHHRSANLQGMYHQPLQDPYCLSHFQILENNMRPDIDNQGTSVSVEPSKEQYFTLESSPSTACYAVCDSPSVTSSLSNISPFSSQVSQSYLSDAHHSPNNNYGSPVSGSSVADNGYDFRHKIREVEILLLGSGPDIADSCYNSVNSGIHQFTSMSRWDWNQLVEKISRLDLREVLKYCAEAVSHNDVSLADALMEVLEKRVSISGDPVQRLSAYMLEGLRARLERSGTVIYKSLRCEPTSSELMSYMSILYDICPYWKFAYISANVVIEEVMENEPRIHIIDFQIAQGSQWMSLIHSLARRPGGPPLVRITGVDDSQSAHARGGGLHIVGQKLLEFAKSCHVPFEFHAAAMSGCEVEQENLRVRPGEALAVNFPYVLHHMPDESVSTQNHRDRLLRLVKSLSPKVMTLIEQESNTNTSPFPLRFKETMEYYTAMFESIDAARLPRDDKQRIRAEENCVARDIVNMIACEDTERVERHEMLGKWNARLKMAEFTPLTLSSSVTNAVVDLLKLYNENYSIMEKDGALYLRWRNRCMATSSAWR
ncbi:scarecrow-like protein 13 [Juglans microcarpa x Juglans regia]|uniref:scarecrow-like protein 13 n=1 Tax=Juglans microcarpa x Juglans regia TaxID=2249226 RepID=UPI001B7DB43E|nr:scarecrow-like protein 13 [Juglans microcarpa x Juglans regia]